MVYVITTMPRKKQTIKLSEVERLGKLQCLPREAAGFLGIRLHTFRRLLRDDDSFRKAWEDGKQMGLVGLRRKQMSLAGSNATMAIFMGKQYLGQKDVVTQEHTGPDGMPMDLDLTSLSKEDRDALRSILTRAARAKPAP